MRIFKHKPSPAMIVAIAALSVSLVGTAVAGPIAEISLNKGEKKQIRKISRNISNRVSNRRISQRAPGLSVATANLATISSVSNFSNNATNAQNAENAENAEDAENAENAATVNGQAIHKVAFRTTSAGLVGPQTVFNEGGLTIRATCSAEQLTLVATTSKQDSSIYVNSTTSTPVAEVLHEHQESGTFDAGDTQDLLAGGNGNHNLIAFEFDAVDGTVVTGQINADENGTPGGCRATGHVIVG